MLILSSTATIKTPNGRGLALREAAKLAMVGQARSNYTGALYMGLAFQAGGPCGPVKLCDSLSKVAFPGLDSRNAGARVRLAVAKALYEANQRALCGLRCGIRTRRCVRGSPGKSRRSVASQ